MSKQSQHRTNDQDHLCHLEQHRQVLHGCSWVLHQCRRERTTHNCFCPLPAAAKRLVLSKLIEFGGAAISHPEPEMLFVLSQFHHCNLRTATYTTCSSYHCASRSQFRNGWKKRHQDSPGCQPRFFHFLPNLFVNLSKRTTSLSDQGPRLYFGEREHHPAPNISGPSNAKTMPLVQSLANLEFQEHNASITLTELV